MAPNNVSIVVSPRERLTALPASLRSLFATIPPDVPVVVVEGGTPDEVRSELALLHQQRPFRHLQFDNMLIPNFARNCGARETATEYVVFTDNDIHYQPGWLEALLDNAAREGADAVAPLICIGPPAATTIHHAGGTLALKHKRGRPILFEHHRLSHTPLRKFSDAAAPVDNEVCEFHCCMMRRALFDRIGGLDERLITREQMDFALRCMALGARVTFAADSVVTYMAFTPFDPVDLPYHMFRWADVLAVRSMDAFEASWGIPLDRPRVRYRWIARHRSQAVASRHKAQRLLFGRLLFDRLVARRYELAVADQVTGALEASGGYVPVAPEKSALELLESSRAAA